MEKIADVFINWQVLLLSFAAFVVLGLLRTLGTRKENGKIVGGFAQNKYFGMFMPAYPYVLTLGMVFLPGSPLPEIVTETLAIKIMYALYAGWLSGFSFQLIKNVLEKAGVSFEPKEPAKEDDKPVV